MEFSDTLEKDTGAALTAAGIVWTRPQRLDFYLPDYGVFIEIKQYHSERANDQLKSQNEVILIQGKKALAFFIKMISKNG